MRMFLIFIGALIAPLLMSLLLKAPVFKSASGDVEAWISFWGSYVGALIGAVTVYLVTSLQVEAQRNTQLESIKTEHANALEREMKQFHFKNEIDKLEQLDDLLEETLESIYKSANEFTIYITVSHFLYGGQDVYSDEEKELYAKEIKLTRDEEYNWIRKFTKISMKLERFAVYFEDVSKDLNDISNQLFYYLEEIKSGYNDNYSFKKYLYDFNKPVLEHHLTILESNILNLKRDKIHPKLQGKIHEMKMHSNF